MHDVSGTAVIVDNCTVEIRDFTYDGTGLDVRVYGAGASEGFEQGYAMTENLLRATPYDGETITATLPDGESLDDLGKVSVWCLDVPVDFGSGTFSAL